MRPRTHSGLIAISAALALTACAHHPRSWRVELLDGVAEPAGWQDVMAAARAQASCAVTGQWGGTIAVHAAPYVIPDGRVVWGDTGGDHQIGIVYSPFARDGALPEEACHVGLSICEKDYTEPPAKSCAAAVKARLTAVDLVRR